MCVGDEMNCASLYVLVHRVLRVTRMTSDVRRVVAAPVAYQANPDLFAKRKYFMPRYG